MNKKNKITVATENSATNSCSPKIKTRSYYTEGLRNKKDKSQTSINLKNKNIVLSTSPLTGSKTTILSDVKQIKKSYILNDTTSDKLPDSK